MKKLIRKHKMVVIKWGANIVMAHLQKRKWLICWETVLIMRPTSDFHEFEKDVKEYFQSQQNKQS